MYFFLRNLSFADLCFSTTTVPQVLVHFLVKRKTISFAGCSTQIVVLLLVGCTECALLAVMSYDRYVAVCKPLHYTTIMTHRVCAQLATGSWASGAFVSLVDTTFTLCLPYRGNNIINHFFLWTSCPPEAGFCRHLQDRNGHLCNGCGHPPSSCLPDPGLLLEYHLHCDPDAIWGGTAQGFLYLWLPSHCGCPLLWLSNICLHETKLQDNEWKR